MRSICFFVFLLLAGGSAQAASGFECVKTQCENKGRACVETLYVSYNACTKTARAKCETVPLAEKFECLRSGLRPCALTRNEEQAACLADARACYQTCAPFQGKQTRYWCVADTRLGATATFCEANPGASPFEQCTKAFDKAAEITGSMTCEPL
ncbi:MAG: hypothetical protein KF835_11485 [Xanthobacteraceae bacterium]|nr:hypothetical protein [Xanthobacteraceae bacterium]